MVKLNKDIVKCLAVAFIMGVPIYLSTQLNKEKKEYEIKRLDEYSRISQMISDFDGKPGTSFDDWAIVYDKALGYSLDQLRDQPKNLSLEELERIDVDEIRKRIHK